MPMWDLINSEESYTSSGTDFAKSKSRSVENATGMKNFI
jgi:hypothetical protein